MTTSIDEDSSLKHFLKTDLSAKQRLRIFIDTFSIHHGYPIFSGDALRSLSVNNAGGSSALSEAFSIQYMICRFAVYEFILEMEVKYWVYNCSIVDYVMKMANDGNVGVSVTRAMNHIDPLLFTFEDGMRLLSKKLYGLIIARNGASSKNSFHKCILHVFCQCSLISEILSVVHERILQSIEKDDPIHDVRIVLTVCSEDWLYSNVVKL